MSLILAFMELDKLYESSRYQSRDAIIKELKELGKDYYNFDEWSDANLARMLEKAKKAKNEAEGMREYNEILNKEQSRLCQNCGKRLIDNGKCSSCSNDELDYFFDESMLEWIDANGTGTNSVMQPGTASKIVTIVYDNSKHKLRAQADDGVHGKGYVSFPNNLRTTEGQQYEVETLIWNGKNYRISGNIKAI